jgi:multidrug transporter EmrE-like cation transporter
MVDWIFVSLTALSGLFFTLGDILFKWWAGKSNHMFMVGALMTYLIAGLFLAFSFQRRELAVANAVMISFNIMAVTIAGFTIFKEVLGLKEIIGITLVIIAVIIFNI